MKIKIEKNNGTKIKFMLFFGGVITTIACILFVTWAVIGNVYFLESAYWLNLLGMYVVLVGVNTYNDDLINKNDKLSFDNLLLKIRNLSLREKIKNAKVELIEDDDSKRQSKSDS